MDSARGSTFLNNLNPIDQHNRFHTVIEHHKEMLIQRPTALETHLFILTCIFTGCIMKNSLEFCILNRGILSYGNDRLWDMPGAGQRRETQQPRSLTQRCNWKENVFSPMPIPSISVYRKKDPWDGHPVKIFGCCLWINHVNLVAIAVTV